MHRRRFLQSAAIAGAASPFAGTLTHARQATPEAPPSQEGDGYLASRVARIDPEALLEALLTTPVATPLFPAETPPIETVAWDDGDTVVPDGAIGGVIFNTGYDAGGSFDPVGLSRVHPNAASASAAVEAAGGAAPARFLGLPWGVIAIDVVATSGVQIDYLHLTGVAEPATGDTTDRGILTLRAISHMTALMDHLESVLTCLKS